MPQIKDFTSDLEKDLQRSDAEMQKTALQRVENQVIHSALGMMLFCILHNVVGFWFAISCVAILVAVIETKQVFLDGNVNNKSLWDILADFTSWITGCFVYFLMYMGIQDNEIFYNISAVLLWLSVPVGIAGAFSVAYGFKRI